MMTDERMKEIETVTNGATSEPWAYDDEGNIYYNHGLQQTIFLLKNDNIEDSKFAALARTAVPELLEEVKDYQALRAYYREIEDQLHHTQARLDYEASEVKRLQETIDRLQAAIKILESLVPVEARHD